MINRTPTIICFSWATKEYIIFCLVYENGKSSSGDSSWYSSWSDVCHKTSFGPRGLIPKLGDNWPSSTDWFFGSSSFHLSIERRRAFMKKLPTVVGSRPNCLAIVTCISFDGLFVSCKNNFNQNFVLFQPFFTVCHCENSFLISTDATDGEEL